MKQGLHKKSYLILLSSILAVALGVMIALNIVLIYWDQAVTLFLGTIGEGVAATEGADYFKSAYDSDDALIEAQAEFTERLAGEAMVLLKNEDDSALPLQAGLKVSLFGIASASGVTSGSGSGEVATTGSHTWVSSLQDAGFSVNQTLTAFYANSGYKHGTGTSAGSGSEKGDWSINEVPQSAYTQQVKSSYSDYKDVAVVVFARGGGEGGDLATEMSRHGGSADAHYLELSDEEKDLLRAVKAENFGTTIVVINSANAMELGFLDEEQYGVDACIWTAGTGTNGLDAFGKILKGEINPSGRLVDTYVYDNFSSPAMQNFGDFRYVDSNDNLTGYSYMNYSEGIYVGYKYYETRYEDVVTGRANVGSYDYATTVKFPFGFGKSYTTFSFSNFSVTTQGEEVTLSVDVTNTGAVQGKEVVEFYVQSPYTEYDIANKVEKAAVSLIDFGKTDMLGAGETQNISVTVPLQEIASYDYFNAETYILEDSDEYYFTVAENAHDAVNHILSAKGYTTADGMTENGNADLAVQYAVSNFTKYDTSASGATITNQFEDCDVDGYTYLTRNNWKMMDGNGIRYATGTKSGISNVTDANGTVGTVVASEQITAALKNMTAEGSGNPISSTNYPDADSYTYGADNGVELIDMMGVDYKDTEAWNKILDELLLSEQHALFGKGGYMTAAIQSINKPKTYEYDGPAGITNMITGAGAYGYPAEIMLAASWSKDLAAEYGKFIGEDALKTKTSGWYAPAMNLHRTPFSGRNYEYYSEDATLSGELAAVEIQEVQKYGVYAYMKHFALNDQETNRSVNGCVAILSNEQAIRELYLKPFRYSVERGNAHGVMTAENRVGLRPAAGNYNLLTKVLRGEWGFEGAVLTDYMSAVEGGEADIMLAAGVDLILCTAQSKLTSAKELWARAALREVAHHVLYVQANSLAMNGFAHGNAYNAGMPVYQLLLIIVDVITVLAIAWGITRIIKAAKMTEEQFMTRARWSKKTKVIFWSVFGAVVVVLIVVFCVTLLPIISSALLM